MAIGEVSLPEIILIEHKNMRQVLVELAYPSIFKKFAISYFFLQFLEIMYIFALKV